MSTTTQARTYGNFTPTRRAGIGGLSAVATVGVLVGLVFLILILVGFGLPAALLWLVLLAVASIPTRKSPRDGRTGYQRLGLRLGFARATAQQQTVYMAGPSGHTPDGKCRLPGLLASSELTDQADAHGLRFGLLTLPQSRHHTVVLDAQSTGHHLVDQGTIDSHVAYFGRWLAGLAEHRELVGASVVVETAPDTGVRLQRMVAGQVDPAAPSFAQQVVQDITTDYSQAAPQILTRVTLTFSGAAVAGAPARDREAMAGHIALVLPSIIASLRQAGAPGARPMLAQDLVDCVRVAYDPLVAMEVEQARAEGGTGLTWDEAGPTYHRESIDTYQHDRAWSRSWQMSAAPTGLIQSDQLTRLLEPDPAIDRKRVTLLYRPEDPIVAASLVEQGLKDAEFVANSKRRGTSRDATSIQAARRTAEEEARGAGLVRFGMIVTATVTDKARLPRAAAVVQRLAAPARLRLRPALGSQSTTFAAGLPVGLVLPHHMAIPASLQDVL